jgi:hypothetical protein
MGNDTKNGKEDARGAIPWYGENSVFGKFWFFISSNLFHLFGLMTQS